MENYETTPNTSAMPDEVTNSVSTEEDTTQATIHPSAEEDPVQEDPSPAEETQHEEEAPASERRRPRVRHNRATNNNAVLDYMDGVVEVSSTVQQYRDELIGIQDIIEHNNRVRREGRGEPIFINAMMTANEEIRAVEGDPNSLVGMIVKGQRILEDRKTLGILPLVFDGGDFTAYSGLIYDESEPESSMYRRQRQYTSHAPGSKFKCAPLQILKPSTKNGLPEVVCSRAMAMEYYQNKFFFADKALAHEGDHGIAYVMAAYPNKLRVEFMGIEVDIPRGRLTARRLISDASEAYPNGTGLEVAITHLDVDREARTIDVTLSGVQCEIDAHLVTNVKDIKLANKPRYMAQVLVCTKEYYVVRLIHLGVIGLIAKTNVYPAGSVLTVNNNVWMEVTGVDENTNRVIGSCFKI